MIRRAAVLMCLAVVSCGAARTQQPAAVVLGAEITLAPGTAAAVTGAEMTVRFVGVTEDSRCPVDATCVWQGEAKAQLAIEISRVSSQVTLVIGDNTIAGGYRVTLVRVEPRPSSTAPIAAGDYRATLKIDKI